MSRVQQNCSRQPARPRMRSQSSPLQRSPRKSSRSWTKSQIQRTRSVGLEGVDPRAERGEVDPAVAHHRRTEDRLAAVDLPDDGAVGPVEHVVLAGHRAEVEVLARHRRRRDVVAVGLAAGGLELPEDFERRGVEAARHAGAVDHVDPAVGDDRRGEDGVGHAPRRPPDPSGVDTLRPGTSPERRLSNFDWGQSSAACVVVVRTVAINANASAWHRPVESIIGGVSRGRVSTL